MKKYVWSETVVEGGKPYKGSLAHPPSNTGAFQNVGVRDLLPAPEGAAPVPQFYADVAVIAYRRPVSDVRFESLQPKVTSSAGTPDLAMLTEGDLEKTVRVPIPKIGESAWNQYEFPHSQRISSVTLVAKQIDLLTSFSTGATDPEESLESSDDGVSFREVVKLPDGGAPEHTVSFLPVKAKFFRVVFKPRAPFAVPAWFSAV